MSIKTWFINQIKEDWAFHCENARESWQTFKVEGPRFMVFLAVLFLVIIALAYVPGLGKFLIFALLFGGLFK